MSNRKPHTFDEFKQHVETNIQEGKALCSCISLPVDNLCSCLFCGATMRKGYEVIIPSRERGVLRETCYVNLRCYNLLLSQL